MAQAEEQEIPPHLKETPFVSQAETNKTHDGETDPAVVIKAANQRRVFQQHGLPWPPEGPDIPAAAEPPTVATLDPNTAEIGGEDITLVVIGANFDPATKIIFNGGEEPTEVMSNTQCSTIVKPSLAGAATEVMVGVRNDIGESSGVPFYFTEPDEARSTRKKGR